jgi:recombination protein RecA
MTTKSNKSNKSDNYKKFFDTISKDMKDTTIIHGKNDFPKVKRLPTGDYMLDKNLGGGYPVGRVIEFMGEESSGKTFLSIMAMVQVQKQGGVAMFVDVEHAFDAEWAELNGLNVEELIFIQPTTAEETLDVVQKALETNVADIIVVDSIAAMIPQAELDGEAGDMKMGLHARLMSQGLKKITSLANNTETTVMFINQYRMKIGVMFGDPRVTTGGNSMKFYASLRMEISKGSTIKDGEEVIGNIVKYKIKKNKTAPPFRSGEFEISYAEGYNTIRNLIIYAVDAGIVDKSGSWYAYDGTKLGQGLTKVEALLNDNPELTEEIEVKVKEFFK